MSIGYARQGRPNVTSRPSCSVVRIVTEGDVATIAREQDPFGLAHACRSAGGHVLISVGDAIVCEHCSRIFWP